MNSTLKFLGGTGIMGAGVYLSIQFTDQVLQVALGAAGPLLVLTGAFIAWLESDEVLYSSEERDRQQTLGTGAKEGTERKEAEPVQRDYSQALSGTVDDAKEAIRKMDNPNHDALIAAERGGKGRKTLLNWLENRR